MINNANGKSSAFRWTTFKNGVRAVAIVNIDVLPNSLGRNEVEEHYTGSGYVSQGNLEEVPATGYDSWKIAARNGLEYAFSLVSTHWTVYIKKIEGRSLTDTNPTVVGYTILLAFLDRIGYQLDKERADIFEDFVVKSWTKPYQELIPDFFNLTYTEQK